MTTIKQSDLPELLSPLGGGFYFGNLTMDELVARGTTKLTCANASERQVQRIVMQHTGD